MTRISLSAEVVEDAYNAALASGAFDTDPKSGTFFAHYEHLAGVEDSDGEVVGDWFLHRSTMIHRYVSRSDGS